MTASTGFKCCPLPSRALEIILTCANARRIFQVQAIEIPLSDGTRFLVLAKMREQLVCSSICASNAYILAIVAHI